MNKKLQKQKIRQKRQIKKGQKKKIREKRILKAKRITGPKKKPALQKVTDMKSVPLWVKIRFYIYKAIGKIKRLSCLIGIHDWKLCSGREGNSMFTCIKCWKGSDKKWAPGGSEKHYKEQGMDQKEIANPKNWKKKEGKYYFKGQYVRLSKEEVKRLEIMLGKKKK